MAPKWSILVSQCEMDHQKPTILLNFGTLSLGGCWGHPLRPKLNLKNKGQISISNEYTDNIKLNLTCIFLSFRAKLKKPLCPRTLCTNFLSHSVVQSYDGATERKTKFPTLESGINVGVRLLIFELFLGATFLLKWATFINFWILGFFWFFFFYFFHFGYV